jgi:hypothetical protein
VLGNTVKEQQFFTCTNIMSLTIRASIEDRSRDEEYKSAKQHVLHSSSPGFYPLSIIVGKYYNKFVTNMWLVVSWTVCFRISWAMTVRYNTWLLFNTSGSKRGRRGRQLTVVSDSLITALDVHWTATFNKYYYKPP